MDCPRRTIIVGDSFIRRLERVVGNGALGDLNPRFYSFSFVGRLPSRSNLAYIEDLYRLDMADFCESSVAVFHVGGNDVMREEIHPQLLARRLFQAVSDILLQTRIKVAILFKQTHRYGIPAFTHPSSRFSYNLNRNTISQKEDEYNLLIDIFNDELTRLCNSSPSFRYATIQGIAHHTQEYMVDGTHFNIFGIQRQICAIKKHTIVGFNLAKSIN